MDTITGGMRMRAVILGGTGAIGGATAERPALDELDGVRRHG
ncbi:hypothetical protein [Leifsonia sp. Root227]|nr:hypothetical protein [Leifsonia sp. Root227]